ncbi:hypothetical protein D3227_15000 [Mesorhizobium waimense]|uniref:Helicase n=1 Tax=Mesorhizobium waimense TaxID=1300307 RepID=A0A3A5KSG8_9HYPH|nr:hypothetical protein [Mesorhizobium waimense]RJT39103.1 hypothetical protein D3227_15000 [Mesorhizobium waimense]
MIKYVVAALTIVIAIGPASALDTSIGGKVGGLGVDAGVSAGSQGASVGVGASVGGLGVDAGGSAGSQGASVGVGASVGGLGVDAGVSPGSQGASKGVGASVGAGAGDDPSAENQSATAPGSPASVTTATAPAKTAKQSVVLPPILRPSKAGQGHSTKGYPFGSLRPLKGKPGTPAAVVRTCRAAIISAAAPLGAVRVQAVSAGALRQRRGALTAPIEVRIDYTRKDGIEVRRAHVDCRLDAAGRVIAIV